MAPPAKTRRRDRWEDDGEWVTTAQAADFLQVHTQTVQRYVRDGILPATRINNRIRLLRSDVEGLLADGYGGPDGTGETS